MRPQWLLGRGRAIIKTIGSSIPEKPLDHSVDEYENDNGESKRTCDCPRMINAGSDYE